MWGQENEFLSALINRRIIPTRVGTRLPFRAVKIHGKDHPHACGDKSKGAKRQVAKLGSSPRVWGQACFIACCLTAVRIIPTRVGTSGIQITLALLDGRIIPTRVGTSTKIFEGDIVV